jgi:hypothetical protein
MAEPKNDTCVVGNLKTPEPRWEIFDVADTSEARKLWCKMHGDAHEDDLCAVAYNSDDVARSYGIIQ